MKLFKSLYKVATCLALLLVLTNEFIDAGNRSNRTRRRGVTENQGQRGAARRGRRPASKRRAPIRGEHPAQFEQPAAQQPEVLNPSQGFELPDLYVPLPDLQPVIIEEIKEPEEVYEQTEEPVELVQKESPYFSMVTMYLNRLHAPYVLGRVFKTTYDDVFACISEILKNYNPLTMGIKESRKPWPGGSDIQGATRFITELVSKMVLVGDYAKNVRVLDQDKRETLNVLIQETQKKYQAVLAECRDFAVAYIRYLKETESEDKSDRLSKVSVYDSFVKLYKNLARSYVAFISYFYGTDASVKKHVEQYSSGSIDQVLRVVDVEKSFMARTDTKEDSTAFMSSKDEEIMSKMPALLAAWQATEKALSDLEADPVSALGSWAKAVDVWADFTRSVPEKKAKTDLIFFFQGEIACRYTVKALQQLLKDQENRSVSQEYAELKMHQAFIFSLFAWQQLHKYGTSSVAAADLLAVNKKIAGRMVESFKKMILEYQRNNELTVVVPLNTLVNIVLSEKIKDIDIGKAVDTIKDVFSLNQAFFQTEDLLQHKGTAESIRKAWRNEALQDKNIEQFFAFMYEAFRDYPFIFESKKDIYFAIPWLEIIGDELSKKFGDLVIAKACKDARLVVAGWLNDGRLETEDDLRALIFDRNKTQILGFKDTYSLLSAEQEYWNGLSKDLQNFYKVAAKKADVIRTTATPRIVDRLQFPSVYIYAEAWETKITKSSQDKLRRDQAKNALNSLAVALQRFSDEAARVREERWQAQSRIAQNAVRVVANIYAQLVMSLER